MNAETRRIANKDCGCRILPAHHFVPAQIDRCTMHDMAPALLEDLGLLDLLGRDLQEVWEQLQDRLAMEVQVEI